MQLFAVVLVMDLQLFAVISMLNLQLFASFAVQIYNFSQ